MKYTVETIKDKLCNYAWMYNVGREVYYSSLSFSGADDGNFAIRFMPSHQIEVLSYISSQNADIYYNHWEFDSQQQQVLILKKDGATQLILELPTKLEDQTLVMNVVGGNDRLISTEDSYQNQAPTPTINGTKMAYILGEIPSKDQIKQLQQHNYNLHLIDMRTVQLRSYAEIQEDLMQNANLKEVIIAKNRQLALITDWKLGDSERLSLLVDGGNQLRYSSDLIIGKRALVLELLNAMLIESNHYQLSHNNTLPSWNDLFNETINKYFKDRVRSIKRD